MSNTDSRADRLSLAKKYFQVNINSFEGKLADMIADLYADQKIKNTCLTKLVKIFRSNKDLKEAFESLIK